MAFLTTGQAAEQVGVSRATIKNWARAKKINTLNTGRYDLIPDTELPRMRALRESFHADRLARLEKARQKTREVEKRAGINLVSVGSLAERLDRIEATLNALHSALTSPVGSSN